MRTDMMDWSSNNDGMYGSIGMEWNGLEEAESVNRLERMGSKRPLQECSGHIVIKS